MVRDVKFMNGAIGALALGAGFGALTSLINDVSSPYRPIGSRVVNAGGTWVAKVAEVASLLLDIGWAWAGVAVAVGWLAGTRLRGSIAGVLALLAATTAYYCVDGLLLREPLAWHGPEIVLWWLASVVFGSALGVVGASIRQPGVVGLLAALTVPAGAIVQLIFLPPWGVLVYTAAIWAQVIMWAGALVCIGIIVTRYLAARPHRVSGS